MRLLDNVVVVVVLVVAAIIAVVDVVLHKTAQKHKCSFCQPSLTLVTTTTTSGSILFPSQRTFSAQRTQTFGLF